MAILRAAHFPGRAPIDAYGNGGFRFAEMSHRGSLLLLPSGIHGWDVRAPEHITRESLARALDEAAQIEVFLIGVGAAPFLLTPMLKAALRAAGLAPEAMTTGAAVRTYNILLGENRAAAAALIAVD